MFFSLLFCYTIRYMVNDVEFEKMLDVLKDINKNIEKVADKIEKLRN